MSSENQLNAAASTGASLVGDAIVKSKGASTLT